MFTLDRHDFAALPSSRREEVPRRFRTQFPLAFAVYLSGSTFNVFPSIPVHLIGKLLPT
jgi:hypothetical protein